MLLFRLYASFGCFLLMLFVIEVIVRGKEWPLEIQCWKTCVIFMMFVFKRYMRWREYMDGYFAMWTMLNGFIPCCQFYPYFIQFWDLEFTKSKETDHDSYRWLHHSFKSPSNWQSFSQVPTFNSIKCLFNVPTPNTTIRFMPIRVKCWATWFEMKFVSFDSICFWSRAYHFISQHQIKTFSSTCECYWLRSWVRVGHEESTSIDSYAFCVKLKQPQVFLFFSTLSLTEITNKKNET